MPSDNGRDRNRRSFWLGLILGTLLGAAGLFLTGLVLWDPPF